MFPECLTLSNIYMITGFLISMYSCVSNDVIQTLGTYLTTSKRMPTWLIWAFTSAVLIITISTGWIVNNGDMAFGRLERIPYPETFMKTNVQDPRSATIIDLIYAFLLLYFIQLNNVPMSTTWVFIGLLAGREVALYHRLRFESPKKMYKHILKDLAKAAIGLIVSIVTVFVLIKFDIIKSFFISHFV